MKTIGNVPVNYKTIVEERVYKSFNFYSAKLFFKINKELLVNIKKIEKKYDKKPSGELYEQFHYMASKLNWDIPSTTNDKQFFFNCKILQLVSDVKSQKLVAIAIEKDSVDKFKMYNLIHYSGNHTCTSFSEAVKLLAEIHNYPIEQLIEDLK